MLKKILLIFSIVLLASFIILSISAQKNSNKNDGDESPLQVKIDSVDGFSYSNSEIPIIFTFENVGKEPIKLVNPIIGDDFLRAFFDIKIQDDKGIPFYQTRSIKMFISKDELKYISLKQEEKFIVTINVRKLLPKDFKMPDKPYKVILIYRNTFGDGFRGRIKTNSVLISNDN